MVIFQDIQDVEEWLSPLDYVAFWDAVEPYNLTLQDRAHCDGLIAGADVDANLILRVLKSLAVRELRVAFNLEDRIYEPTVAKYLASTH